MYIKKLTSFCLISLALSVSTANAENNLIPSWPKLNIDHIHNQAKTMPAEQVIRELVAEEEPMDFAAQSEQYSQEGTIKAETYTTNNSFQENNQKIVGKNYNDLEFGILKTNHTYSTDIFDRQDNVTNKAVRTLKARKDKIIDDKSLYIGGRLTATHMNEWTDTNGKFPIISRLPNQHTSGKYGNEDIINDASINATATFKYLTLFAQGEYTEIEYPGQDEKQFRKYYAMLGDLNKAPIYALIGKKSVAFGNFDSYAPFTHNHSSHYFWAQPEDPLLEVGYVTDDINVIASLLPNSRGLRVLSAPEENGYENFALSYRQDFGLDEDTNLQVGAGFLRGSIYNSAIAHHPPTNGSDRNWSSVWNIHSTLSQEKWDLMGEYTQTTNTWPATDHKVSSLTLQARYKDSILDKPTTYSVMFSKGVQGDSGTEWEQMSQFVAGIEIKPLPHLEIGAEYLFNDGFVPLILPKITGDQSVQAHSAIVGIQLTF